MDINTKEAEVFSSQWSEDVDFVDDQIYLKRKLIKFT